MDGTTRAVLIDEIQGAILNNISCSSLAIDVLESVIPQGLDTWGDDELKELASEFREED